MARRLESASERQRRVLWSKRLNLEAALGVTEEEPPHRMRLGHLWRQVLVTAVLRATGTYAWGQRNALRPVLRERPLYYPDLPRPMHGFRLLHLTDPHFMRQDGRLAENTAECVRGLKVDVCVWTGDYVFGHFGSQQFLLEPLKNVLGGIDSAHGFFGILGNHDTHETAELLRTAGMDVLLNEGREIRLGGASCWVGGVDDPHKYRSDSVDLAMENAPEDAFRILLAHTPERAEQAAFHGVKLYLCGHTHGGQIRFPVGPAPHLNVRCSRKLADGPWLHKGVQGFTGPGIGTTDVPVRYFCPPEITLFTFLPA